MGTKQARDLPALAAVPEGGERAEAVDAWLAEMHGLAGSGDERAAAALVGAYRAVPSLWERAAGLAADTERAWAGAVAGVGPEATFARALVLEGLAEAKAELAAPGDGALEGLLVGRVAVAWLAAQQADRALAHNLAAGATIGVADALQARAEKADQQINVSG